MTKENKPEWQQTDGLCIPEEGLAESLIQDLKT
jgi:hypothetical protein